MLNSDHLANRTTGELVQMAVALVRYLAPIILPYEQALANNAFPIFRRNAIRLSLGITPLGSAPLRQDFESVVLEWIRIKKAPVRPTALRRRERLSKQEQSVNWSGYL